MFKWLYTNKLSPFGGLLFGLMTAIFASAPSLAYGGQAEKNGKWSKIQTTDIQLNHKAQVSSPGLYDIELQKFVTFPADGSGLQFNFPHEGKTPDGKKLPALTGYMKGSSIWLDLDGNGKTGPREVSVFKKSGTALGPFVYRATYADGSSGAYPFLLIYTGKVGKFRILRCSAKQFNIGKTRLLILDDNGNGRFDDIGRDALLVGNEPVTFLSRQVFIEGKLHEILVHPAGQIVEVRTLANVPMGKVNLFLLYKAPQKSESLRIRTLIIRGRDGAFSFDKNHPQRDVPIGAYDLVYGLFSRSKELVVLKSGERTSFSVEAGKVASPEWGAPIKGVMKTSNDGQVITIFPPVFTGVGSEIYRPVNVIKIPMFGSKFLVWRDRNLNGVERHEQQASKRFVAGPDGQLQPLTFEHFRNDELQLKTSYSSGVLGKVISEERLTFIYKRRNR